MRTGNLFAQPSGDLHEEQIEVLRETPGVRIERIVSRGHTSPDDFWYDQPRDEWVVLLTGSARLELEERTEPLELRPGDWVDLPANARHRVTWTAPDRTTIWLAIHYPKGPSRTSTPR